jgi:hypothetical protein
VRRSGLLASESLGEVDYGGFYDIADPRVPLCSSPTGPALTSLSVYLLPHYLSVSVPTVLPTVPVLLMPRGARAVLLKIYAHCIDGQADAANQRITDALGAQNTRSESEPGDEGDEGSEQAS